MQSKITIEVDFNDNNTPYLRVIHRRSDDVRDKLLNNFLISLAGESSWCKIFCDGPTLPDEFHWKIKAITPDQFDQESEILAEQTRVSKANQEQFGHLPTTK